MRDARACFTLSVTTQFFANADLASEFQITASVIYLYIKIWGRHHSVGAKSVILHSIVWGDTKQDSWENHLGKGIRNEGICAVAEGNETITVSLNMSKCVLNF